jgi:hypothetical protein
LSAFSPPNAETTRPAFEPAKVPANCGLFVRDQKTPVRIGLHGGPGRIRTSNQTVMSAVTSSEVSMTSSAFHYLSQRMFTIGCGQSLAKRWSAVVVNPKDDIGDITCTKGRGAHQRLGSPPPWSASSPPRRYTSQLTAAHRGPTPSSFEGPANEPAYKFPAYRCHPRVGSPYPYRGCTTGTGGDARAARGLHGSCTGSCTLRGSPMQARRAAA